MEGQTLMLAASTCPHPWAAFSRGSHKTKLQFMLSREGKQRSKTCDAVMGAWGN